MIDWLAQAGILVFGCSAIWFVGRREKWRRWGYILGMCSAPFWFWTAIANQQYGIVAINFVYAYSWGQGIWNFWIRPKGDDDGIV